MRGDEVVCSKFRCVLKVKPTTFADAGWRMGMSEMIAGARWDRYTPVIAVLAGILARGS